MKWSIAPLSGIVGVARHYLGWMSFGGVLLLSACSSSSTTPPKVEPAPVLQAVSFASPQDSSMQIIARHCQLIDVAAQLPVYCQFNTHQGEYELALSFSHYDISRLYLLSLSQHLIAPYCQAVSSHQAQGQVVVQIFATQIQRRYDCVTQNWAEWQTVSTPLHSPFIKFIERCQRWDKQYPAQFHCNIDWYQQTPILVFTFPDMQPASALESGQPASFIQDFCHSGMKEFGEALYLVEVPSFNLAKVIHCGAEVESEWFVIDPELEPAPINGVI